MSWPEDLKVIEVEAGKQIDLAPHQIGGHAYELCPIEVYVKPDGTVDDLPSVLFVLLAGDKETKFFAQCSFRMLKPMIAALEEAERKMKHGKSS